MTKAELIEENEKLTNALNKILEMTSYEHVEEVRKRESTFPYACIVGEIESTVRWELRED